jgi:hypothetical protein
MRLGLLLTPLDACLGNVLTRLLVSVEGSGKPGAVHTHTQQRCDPPDPFTVIRRREDAFPKIQGMTRNSLARRTPKSARSHYELKHRNLIGKR